MSPSRSLLVGILGLLVPPLALAEELARRTLAECIALAVQQQPTLRAATASVEAGRERVWETAAAYLPQVSATYTATRRQTSPGALTGANIAGRSQTFNFYATGVGFSQILFDFGQNLALIHAAQASAEALAADEQTQHDTVIFNVEQAYFTLLAAYRLRDVADQTVEQNRKHLETAQGRFDVGLAARFDVTQAQVQLASAEPSSVPCPSRVGSASYSDSTPRTGRRASIRSRRCGPNEAEWRSGHANNCVVSARRDGTSSMLAGQRVPDEPSQRGRP